MQTISEVLREEECKLNRIVKQASERVRNAPKGSLRISNNRGRVEYYYKSKGIRSGNGKYIKKKDYELAQKLAQRDYDIQVIKKGQERIKEIKRFIDTYEKTDLGELYQKINKCRRELISPFIVSDEEYVQCWQEVKYEGKSFFDETQEIITERGERVRSKSEKIIADKLYALGIPYRYEYPLVLEGNIKLYPDFTILRMPMREEVYLEHLGMLDDSNYMDSVSYKMHIYERNEIYLGVNLFITHETKKYPLNTRVLEQLIKNVFCATY